MSRTEPTKHALTFQKGDSLVVYSADGAHRVPGYVWAIENRKYATVILFMGFVGEERIILELVDGESGLCYRGQLVTVRHEALPTHDTRRIKSFRHRLERIEAESMAVRGSGLLPVDVLDKEVNRIAQLRNAETKSEVELGIRTPTYVEVCSWFNEANRFHPDRKPLAYFREPWNIFRYRSDSDRERFLSLHARTPTGFKKYFKSTKEAYQKAHEFVESGRKNRFGYTVLAKDGHVCNSLGEAQIDDYLSSMGALHIKEPSYPGDSNWRADFKVGDYYIEFFGLTGNLAYDRKTEQKIRYAIQLNIRLIALYPTDLEDGSFKNKLAPAISAGHV